MNEHDRLWSITKKLPGDYKPYGVTERNGPDCSCGCLYARALEGDLGMDWVVCTNPASHRVGLLTFEHQGCMQFEVDDAAF